MTSQSIEFVEYVLTGHGMFTGSKHLGRFRDPLLAFREYNRHIGEYDGIHINEVKTVMTSETISPDQLRKLASQQ